MDDTASLNQSLERLIWDFMDLHGFTSSRKAEITLMAALTMFLIQQGQTHMKDLVTAFNVSNSTVTDYVDFLEKKGFVTRARGNKDRREVHVRMTKKGQAWIKHSRDITNDYMEERLSKLTPDERKTLISLVNKIFENDAPQNGSVSPVK
jgi:DNA-binding MarR family transcriptional regulator